MTTYIYMNEQVRKAKPSRPVIVVQNGKHVEEANGFTLFHGGKPIGRVVFDPKGLPACETHDVKAWVELDDTVHVGLPEDMAPEAPKPTATEKKPNTPIDFKLKFR